MFRQFSLFRFYRVYRYGLVAYRNYMLYVLVAFYLDFCTIFYPFTAKQSFEIKYFTVFYT